MTSPLKVTIADLPNGDVQIIIRSQWKTEVLELMGRYDKQYQGIGQLLRWLGPIKTPSKTWTAIARGPAYSWPVVHECSDEQGEFGIENAPQGRG